MTREGRVVGIKKTVKADGVSGLRIMKKEALDLWGIRFSNMQNIAKGTTDPRVEFISQVQTQILIKFHLQNLNQASIS